MATYNSSYTTGASINIPTVNMTVSGVSFVDGRSVVNIKAGSVKVKAGYLAQIYNGADIVWESKKAYKDSAKAYEVSEKKISSSIDKLFNK